MDGLCAAPALRFSSTLNVVTGRRLFGTSMTPAPAAASGRPGFNATSSTSTMPRRGGWTPVIVKCRVVSLAIDEPLPLALAEASRLAIAEDADAGRSGACLSGSSDEPARDARLLGHVLFDAEVVVELKWLERPHETSPHPMMGREQFDGSVSERTVPSCFSESGDRIDRACLRTPFGPIRRTIPLPGC